MLCLILSPLEFVLAQDPLPEPDPVHDGAVTTQAGQAEVLRGGDGDAREGGRRRGDRRENNRRRAERRDRRDRGDRADRGDRSDRGDDNRRNDERRGDNRRGDRRANDRNADDRRDADDRPEAHTRPEAARDESTTASVSSEITREDTDETSAPSAAPALDPEAAPAARTDPNADRETDSEPDLAADAPGFEAFSIVVERNIFDPNRGPGREDEPTSGSAPVEPPAERLTLAGVLLDGAEAVAFFEGDGPGAGARRLGEQIAGHQLAEIRTDQVRLVADGKTMLLPVPGQLVRNGAGQWEAMAWTPPAEGAAGAASGAAGGGALAGVKKAIAGALSGLKGAAPSAEPAAGGAPNDLMQKLMERRRKEMGQ